MSELLDRSRLRRLDVPRAITQNMLFPVRGRPGAKYVSAWGEEDRFTKEKQYEVTLESFDSIPDLPARQSKGTKLRKDGAPRTKLKLARTLGPEHPDLLIALLLVQQASIDGADLIGVRFQQLWRAQHLFSLKCGNYSGVWRKQSERVLTELEHCRLTFVDRGAPGSRERGDEPFRVSGPLLRVFWSAKVCKVAGREIHTRSIERVVWGPAMQHMLDNGHTMSLRADEYFDNPTGAGRIAYLFAPTPAAARARDLERQKRADGAVPTDFNQDSTTLLAKLGYSPDELADRNRRHRLLLPIQKALDRRALFNGHLSVSVTRHQPPNKPRHDWRLSIRVVNRRPSHSTPVEDATFTAALEGGRKSHELHSILKALPALDATEETLIHSIWNPHRHNEATVWARKVKGFLPEPERGTFREILAEAKMMKDTGAARSAAAVAVGLGHKLLRTHEWALPNRRTSAGPPG